MSLLSTHMHTGPGSSPATPNSPDSKAPLTPTRTRLQSPHPTGSPLETAASSASNRTALGRQLRLLTATKSPKARVVSPSSKGPATLAAKSEVVSTELNSKRDAYQAASRLPSSGGGRASTFKTSPEAHGELRAAPSLWKSSIDASAALSRLQQQGYGWVTLVTDGRPLVSRHVSRLPGAVRQRHLQHWTRRAAVDSERERCARWRGHRPGDPRKSLTPPTGLPLPLYSELRLSCARLMCSHAPRSLAVRMSHVVCRAESER